MAGEKWRRSSRLGSNISSLAWQLVQPGACRVQGAARSEVQQATLAVRTRTRRGRRGRGWLAGNWLNVLASSSSASQCRPVAAPAPGEGSGRECECVGVSESSFSFSSNS